MSNLPRYAAILALGLGCACFHAAANSQTKPTSKAPTGSVSGRVTIHGKAKAGIIVSLRNSDFGPQQGFLFKGTTGPDGNYRIADVPAGTYQLRPMAPAFVVSDAGAFGSGGKTLVLAEGESVGSIDFSIVRGGVITGKVARADGRPIIEERITVMPAEQKDQRGPMGYSGSFQTDDRGVYRIYGLPAGRYIVAVGQANDGFSDVNPARLSFQRLFYADVTNPNEAKVIELGEGGEATNIDITIGEIVPRFAASGIVVDGETDQPLANVRLGVQRIMGEGNASFTGPMAASNSHGEFRLENITPGKYAILILPQQNSDMRSEGVPFEVVDQDATGLMLRASKGATVTGTVVLEGNPDKTVLAKIAQLRVQAFVRGEGVNVGFGQVSQVGPDGSFRIGGLPAGTVNFSLGAQDRSLLTGFMIARVERDGVVESRGLDVKSGEKISGVKIFISYGSGIVRGSVRLENGPPPADAHFTVRLTRAGDNISTLQPRELDARGHFILQGIPAGFYDLQVNSFIPGLRGKPPSAKQRITVTEGAVTEVELIIDLKSDPGLSP
ncbi:MAG: hypothetical protein M3Y84_13685 [Acidobacteriota bacterium]|nr:hypothetical protein [Acidobacteriota bacterium]